MRHWRLCALLGMIAAPSSLNAEDAAYDSITAGDLARHIEELASDAYLGRGPGTEGETKTVSYLVNAFRNAGLSPGYKDSFEQPVPLVEVTRDGSFEFSVSNKGHRQRFEPFTEFVLFDGNGDGKGSIENAKLVFAGYGITAPEFGWDDYAGADVKDAIVIVMRGEPEREGDEGFFMGAHLTPHYHPDVKSELAAKHGARGMILIHTEASAGWPWSLMTSGGAGKSQSFLASRDFSKLPNLSMQISEPATRELFAGAGQDYDQLVATAKKQAGQVVDLGIRGSMTYRGTRRIYNSRNVVARIVGAETPDECVIYTAHWDHVGVNEDLEGDQIFNGAIDNATGTAAMIELAEAYAALPEKPRRSVYIIATTAEEKGLLGAEHLVQDPVCDPAKTVAVLNMDSHFPYGSFPAMTIVGYGFTEIQQEFDRAAKRMGRVLQPDSNPSVGAFYRNDAYPFARAGIPSIFAVGGPKDEDLTEDSPIMALYQDYGANRYHKPADEYDAKTWDLTGPAEDTKIYFDAGRALANGRKFPNWRYDLSFRQMRDAMRGK